MSHQIKFTALFLALIFAAPVMAEKLLFTSVFPRTECPDLNVDIQQYDKISFVAQTGKIIETYHYQGCQRSWDSLVCTWYSQDKNVSVTSDSFCSLGNNEYGLCWNVGKCQYKQSEL